MFMTFFDQGILGLSPPRNQNLSVFYQAINDKLLDKPIFTAYMRNCQSSCLEGWIFFTFKYHLQGAQ
jgi:hypothetical protein